jgi:hypothetical protein
MVKGGARAFITSNACSGFIYGEQFHVFRWNRPIPSKDILVYGPEHLGLNGENFMRTVIKPLLAIVLVVVVAWLGLWWYAQRQLQEGFTAWANGLSSSGDVQVSYDSIERSGSPLVAMLTVNNLRVAVQPSPAAAPLVITLPAFAMQIDAAAPLLLHFNLPNRINIAASHGDFVLTFGSIAQTEQLDPSALLRREPAPFSAADTQAQNINLLASSGSLMVLHADSYRAHSTFNRHAGAGQNAFSGRGALENIAVSPLLTRIASIPFDGRIAHLGWKLNIDGPEPADWATLAARYRAVPADDHGGRMRVIARALHDWAAHGGTGAGGIDLAIGPSTLHAAGDVAFDAQVQPQGHASLIADHLDAFTAAILNAYPQVQDTVHAMEARLSPYLSSTPRGGQTLTFKATYGNGAVMVNGKKVGSLPPIDWSQLETAPPPQAPGDGSGAAL